MTGNIRHTVVMAALLTTLLAVGSCSSGTETERNGASKPSSSVSTPASQSTSPTKSPTSTSSASPSGTPPIGVLVRMPPQDGTTCVSPGYPGDVLLERSTIEPVEDVVLRGVDLEQPMGVELADAWVARTPKGIRDLIGMSNWPTHPEDRAWEEREPAAGARLQEGKRYTLFARIHPDRDAESWEFAQLRLRYAVGSERHVAELGPPMSYGRPCTLR